MSAPPVLTVFRSRLRDGADAFEDGYGAVSARMLDLARTMPGFVEFKSYAADDGERVSIIVFDSMESHNAWRDHPDHRRAQQQGRDGFYAEFRLQVCELVREHGLPTQ